MSEKIDIPPVFRAPPNTKLRDRRKKPDDKPKQNKTHRPKRKPETGREGTNIDEYV